MESPENDLVDRQHVWDILQDLWMDTKHYNSLDSIARQCSQTKYSLSDLEAIYWNEVFPAVSFNRKELIGQWSGFEISGLAKKIITFNRFGKPLPFKAAHPYEWWWWTLQKIKILKLRRKAGGRI